MVEDCSYFGKCIGQIACRPLFGFIAGWLIDKYGPRRLMMAGDLFGVWVPGRTMGIILVADGIAESLFPMLPGALYNDVAKSFAFGFIVLTCVALPGALIVSFLPKAGKSKE